MLTKSPRDPGAFHVEHPIALFRDNSSRHPPVPRTVKLPSSLVNNPPSSAPEAISPILPPGSLGEVPQTCPTKAHPTSPIMKIYRKRLSVADLRNSFEQIAHQQGLDSATEPLPTSRERLSTSVRRLPSKIKTQLLLSEAFSRSSKPVATTSPSQTNRNIETPSRATARSMQMELENTVSKQLSPTPHDTFSQRHSPRSLPTRKRSRQRQALISKSQIFETATSLDMDLQLENFTVERGRLRTSEQEQERSELETRKGLLRPSPSHPLFLCGLSEPPDTCSEEENLGHTLPSPVNLSKFISDRRRKDFLSQSSMPIIKDSSAASKPDPKQKAIGRRTSRVADLRKLFDRTVFKASTPALLGPFGCHQRHTLPNQDRRPLRPDPEEHTQTHVSSSSNFSFQETVSPPELTTDISVNDFSCDFLEKAKPTRTPSPSRSKPRFNSQPGTQQSLNNDSPLKDRIEHFECLNHRARSYEANPRNTFISTAASDKMDLNESEPTHKRYLVRKFWRRISNSLTHSFDGMSDHIHISHSHYETSSSDWAHSPPRSLLPLFPGRNSFSFLERFSNGDKRELSFGLDGANHSKPRHHDHVFCNPEAAVATPDLVPVMTQSSHSTSLPPTKELRKRAERGVSRDQKAQKRAEKLAAKEEKKKGKGKQYAVSTEQHPAGREDGRCEKERNWGDKTASGFMVRQARVDVVAPKPLRPGQVRKVVNMYKDKSTSFLRLASGSRKDGSGCTGAPC